MTDAVLTILAFHATLWTMVTVLVVLEPPRWPRDDPAAVVTSLPRAADVGGEEGQDEEHQDEEGPDEGQRLSA